MEIKKKICDICNEREATRSFKIKRSQIGCFVKGRGARFWAPYIWTPWERIDICNECGEKIINLKPITRRN